MTVNENISNIIYHMYRWFYIWSPRYEIFHRVLQDCVKDISGIQMNPIFLPQSYFQKKVEGHHFTGNSTKFRITLSALDKHPGEYIIMSDTDLIVFNEMGGFDTYLDSYKSNDMTFMLDNYGSDVYNIGFCLIKSTPKTIEFVKHIIHRIDTENGHDQCIVNEELKKYSGPYGYFSTPDVVQSNMVSLVDNYPHRIIQCLTSVEDPDDLMVEKLRTIAMYFDIEPFRYLLSENVDKLFIDYSIRYDPLSVVTAWEPRSSSFQPQTSSSSTASFHPHLQEPPHDSSSELPTLQQTPPSPSAKSPER
jgi:hypothetical protein